MSQENVELVYRANDALNRRDLDAVLALCDPDVELTPRTLELEGGGPYRGHDGVRSWWEDLLGVFPDLRGEIEEVRDLGDVTVARARIRGQGTESDAATEQTAWHVSDWRKGKLVRFRAFGSEAEALEAAGLSE